jgi:hypothetical protein
MDFGMLQQGITAATAALSFIKQAKELLPKGPKKDQVDEALQSAERQLRLAESQIAQGLEHELCRNHFPPAIMLSPDDRNWKCPECTNEKHPPHRPLLTQAPVVDWDVFTGRPIT